MEKQHFQRIHLWSTLTFLWRHEQKHEKSIEFCEYCRQSILWRDKTRQQRTVWNRSKCGTELIINNTNKKISKQQTQNVTSMTYRNLVELKWYNQVVYKLELKDAQQKNWLTIAWRFCVFATNGGARPVQRPFPFIVSHLGKSKNINPLFALTKVRWGKQRRLRVSLTNPQFWTNNTHTFI